MKQVTNSTFGISFDPEDGRHIFCITQDMTFHNNRCEESNPTINYLFSLNSINAQVLVVKLKSKDIPVHK
jgi:hypothetical protein